jgi:hypothetical protein
LVEHTPIIHGCINTVTLALSPPHPHPHPRALAGEVVELPVGGMIRRKSSTTARSQDMARLQALSELLGMTQVC